MRDALIPTAAVQLESVTLASSLYIHEWTSRRGSLSEAKIAPEFICIFSIKISQYTHNTASAGKYLKRFLIFCWLIFLYFNVIQT